MHPDINRGGARVPNSENPSCPTSRNRFSKRFLPEALARFGRFCSYC